MLDAFGKPSAGLMKGVFQWVGNYEECLDVRADVARPRQFTHRPRDSRVQFGAKYCRVVVPVGHFINITFSVSPFVVRTPVYSILSIFKTAVFN